MENNEQPIKKLFETLGIDPKNSQTDSIVDFSVSFGHKLIRKCIELKGSNLSTNKKIKPEDIRQAYESMKMIRSADLTEKQQERKKKLIENTKKILLEEEQPNKVNTVRLHFQNNLEHMMTNKQYQLTFQ